MRRWWPVLLLAVLFAPPALAQEQGPAPPSRVSAVDYPYDWGGGTIQVKWGASKEESSPGFQGYRISRGPAADGPWTRVTDVDRATHAYLDGSAGTDTWFYAVSSLAGSPGSVLEGTRAVADTEAVAEPNAFDSPKFKSLVFVFLFTSLILGWIWAAGRRVSVPFLLGYVALGLVFALIILAAGESYAGVKAAIVALLPLLALAIPILKRNSKIYVRPIPAIQAVEEAIGRSTEMGKPILFVPGISTIEDVATLAALSILGAVAEKAARYDSKLVVPNYDPIVFTVAQEVVRESFLKAGRPDAYSDDNVFYLSARQFAYAAAVNGIMVRDKPATNFFLGMFYAESLLLAETGNLTGAIQIAGTDAVTQLPFFIVACDYTLIGEELYAAGAYMGGDPKLTGGLKGQDWNKAIVIAAMVLLSVGFFVYAAFRSPGDWDHRILDLPETLFKVGQ